VTILFAVLLALALALSMLAPNPAVLSAIALNFVIWTLLGFGVDGPALAKGFGSRPEFAKPGTKRQEANSAWES